MSVLTVDGIKIGPNSQTLPILSFGEYISDPLVIGTLAAGEVKTVTISDIPDLFMGATCFARPMNPQASVHNFDKLCVKYAWIDFVYREVNIMVKNDTASEVAYGEDNWCITYLNTNNLSVYDPETTEVLP